ncbi:MAG: Yop proteins translocation protein L [Chlamydiae bacterium]|nr:Yop proteins translocation protein L [Chlamydiota bacterium]
MKWFSLLYQGDLHPSSDEKVIAANDYSKLVKAIEVLETAREDAKKFLENTEKECEGLREKAKEKGFEEGLEKFNEQIFFLNEQLKTIRLNLQQMVLPIALKAVKRIVGKELETFPETIVDIVMQAIAPIAESHQVTIFVSKEDKKYLDAHRPKLKEILQQAEILTVQEKSDITPGGCIIKTEGGMINATLENQFKALERAFEKYKQNT